MKIDSKELLKKNKFLNFSSELSKKVKKLSDGKRGILGMERNFFGRLLGITPRKKIDMETCFKYPLSPFPPALTYPTGEIFKQINLHWLKKYFHQKKLQFRIV